MERIKLTERREVGQRQIIMGSEYTKNQTLSNTPWTRYYVDFYIIVTCSVYK